MEISDKAKGVLGQGSAKVRVLRNGMYQQLTFMVKKVKLANIEYTELYTERLIDTAEISRIANEVGLPIEAKNGRSFPKGTSAADFQNLSA